MRKGRSVQVAVGTLVVAGIAGCERPPTVQPLHVDAMGEIEAMSDDQLAKLLMRHAGQHEPGDSDEELAIATILLARKLDRLQDRLDQLQAGCASCAARDEIALDATRQRAR